ncbi:PERM1 protein, partial [Erithacus rubecula]|nr:PERM1 protein [Erithacus rubecula]
MDNFEYSIQLNDREWAEFVRASEECSLAPASLATAEEQSLSDIEQGDTSGGDCPRSSEPGSAARRGSEPAAGTGSAATRGVATVTALRWPQSAGQRPAPELLSGSEDGAELGSVGGFLCDSDKPSLPPAAMPSAQRRQPPRPPTATTAAGGTAQASSGQDTAEKGEAMEPPAPPEQGGQAGGGQAPVALPGEVAQPELVAESGAVAQPGVMAQPELVAQPGKAPAASGSAEGAAERSAEPPGDPPSPSLGSVPRVAPEEEKPGAEPSSPGGSPSVVRPKVPAQPRKSRRQRGASGAEGERDPAGAPGAGKAPPGSPVSPRKGRGKDKAKGALVRLGSEEAAENKRPVPGPGGDGGDAPPKQRGKEPGAQSPGKAKGTRQPKAGLGVRDSVPAVPEVSPAVEIPRIPAAEIPRIPAIEIPCEPAAEIPKIPGAGIPTVPGAGIPWEAAAEVPRARSPLCFADGASPKPNSLDVTWPEMYEYLFCDSQEEEELGSSLEGRKSPLPREISWPELYEYLFNEPEGSRKKGKAKDRKRKKFSSLERAGVQKETPSPAPGTDTVVIPVPDVYGHFFPERAPNRMGWRGIFSMASASEVRRAVGALRSLLQRGGSQGSGSQALVPRRCGEQLALVPLGGAQLWPEDGDTGLALRG